MSWCRGHFVDVRSASEHSSTCHCIRFLHNLLNVLVQIANKMGLQKKSSSLHASNKRIIKL
jgi:hypothetical protein